MKDSIVWRLILKDLHLYRWLMVATALAGLASLPLTGPPDGVVRTIGLILFLTSMVALGVFIAMYGVLAERKEKSLLFVLSLPVSPTQYTAAKITAALIAFLIPWSILMAAILWGTIADDSSGGSLPYVIAMMGFFVANFSVLLALLLITGSEAWAVAGVLTTNFAVAAFVNVVRTLPEIAATIDAPVPVWSTTFFAIIAIEVAVVVLTLTLAFYVRSRRRDFV